MNRRSVAFERMAVILASTTSPVIDGGEIINYSQGDNRGSGTEKRSAVGRHLGHGHIAIVGFVTIMSD